jgi:hypothetical protein
MKKKFFLAMLLITFISALIPYPFATSPEESKEKVVLRITKGKTDIPEQFEDFLAQAMSKEYTIVSDDNDYKYVIEIEAIKYETDFFFSTELLDRNDAAIKKTGTTIINVNSKNKLADYENLKNVTFEIARKLGVKSDVTDRGQNVNLLDAGCIEGILDWIYNIIKSTWNSIKSFFGISKSTVEKKVSSVACTEGKGFFGWVLVAGAKNFINNVGNFIKYVAYRIGWFASDMPKKEIIRENATMKNKPKVKAGSKFMEELMAEAEQKKMAEEDKVAKVKAEREKMAEKVKRKAERIRKTVEEDKAEVKQIREMLEIRKKEEEDKAAEVERIRKMEEEARAEAKAKEAAKIKANTCIPCPRCGKPVCGGVHQ